MKKFLLSAVIAAFAVASFIAPAGALGADKDITVVLNGTLSTERILRGIDALPLEKVVSKKKVFLPDIIGGSETKFKWNGIIYTLLIWEKTPGKSAPIYWARVYYQPNGVEGSDYCRIEDIGLDGKVDSGISARTEEKPLPTISSDVDSAGRKYRKFPIIDGLVAHVSDTEATFAKWQERWDEVLGNLGAFLESRNDGNKKLAQKTSKR